MPRFLVRYTAHPAPGSLALGPAEWAALEWDGWKTSPDLRWAEIEVRETDPLRAAKAGIERFERVTSVDTTVEGCPCCPPPHEFSIHQL